MKLVAVAGPMEGREFPLEAEFSIGRDPANSLCIEDGSLSRRHCVVRREGCEYSLHDLGSKNGAYVNGLPVAERALEAGDQIRLGRSLFLFVGEEPAQSTPASVRLDRGGPAPGSTVLLRSGEAVYLQPGKALPPNERTLRDLRTLLEMGRTIPAIRELEALERRILELTFESIPAERGAILIGGHDSGEFLSVYGWRRRSGSNGSMEVSRTVVERVLKESVAILSNDIRIDQDLADAQSLCASRVSSLLAVPLAVFEETLGVLYLDTADPGVRFVEDDLQLLAGIAGIAAAALENALHVRRLESRNQWLQAEVSLQHSMVGEGSRMRAVYDFISKVAQSSATVLVKGESGTGKELVARAIHSNSPRSQRPFMAINCAALTETLLESELFGHEKGAFTGAYAQKRGKLEEAEGGSVFLDEVGELAPALQAKLLRVLQEREFQRVGGTRNIKTDIRLIAATNSDLEAAVHAGRFRQDLYYRLNVVSLTMPALRERKEDIPLLANYFTQKHARSAGRSVLGVSTEARACLMNYDWPGNVRELENAIERAVVLGSTETVLVDDLPETVTEALAPSGDACAGFHEAVRNAKKQIILKALEQAGGSYVEAARLLGLHPSNLHRLIRNLNLRAMTR